MKFVPLLLIALFLVIFTSSCMMGGGPRHLDQQHSDTHSTGSLFSGE